MIGISLDSQLFTRAWLRFAISYALAKHRDLELFLGDRLLSYNKTVQGEGNDLIVDFDSARAKCEKRRNELNAFIRSEVGRLSSPDQARVTVTSWSDYSDAAMEDILRNLQISFVAVPAFRNYVDQDVDKHFQSSTGSDGQNTRRLLSSLYVVEETAMIIRIAELSGKPFFYYPEDEPITIRAIYADESASSGLSVERLTGRPKVRVFTPLPLPGPDWVGTR